jgi:hypothetical protein
MAIKTTIQNLITSLIRSNPALIDKTEHADVEDALLLNSYGTIINEKHTTVSKVITSANPLTNIQYDVDFVKQGRTVTMHGFIRNNTVFLEFIDFLEIVSSEYLPAPVAGDQYVGTTIGDFDIFLSDVDNMLYSTVPANTTVQFSLTYNTLN